MHSSSSSVLSLNFIICSFKQVGCLTPEITENLLSTDWSRPVEFNDTHYSSLGFFLLSNAEPAFLLAILNDKANVEKYSEKFLMLDWSAEGVVSPACIQHIGEMFLSETVPFNVLDYLFSHAVYGDTAKAKFLDLKWSESLIFKKIFTLEYSIRLVDHFSSNELHFQKFTRLFLAIEWEERIQLSINSTVSVTCSVGEALLGTISGLLFVDNFFAHSSSAIVEEVCRKPFTLDWMKPFDCDGGGDISLGYRLLSSPLSCLFLLRLIREGMGDQIIERLLGLDWSIMERVPYGANLSILWLLTANTQAREILVYMVTHKTLGNKVVEQLLCVDWSVVGNFLNGAPSSLGDGIIFSGTIYSLFSKIKSKKFRTLLCEKILEISWNSTLKVDDTLIQNQTVAEIILFSESRESSLLNVLLAEHADSFLDKLLLLNWSAPSSLRLSQDNVNFRIRSCVNGQVGKKLKVVDVDRAYFTNCIAYLLLLNTTDVLKPIFDVITGPQRERVALRFLNELDFSLIVEKTWVNRTITTPVWLLYFQEVISKITHPSKELMTAVLCRLKDMDFEISDDRQRRLFFITKFWEELEIFLTQPENEYELIDLAIKLTSSPQFKASYEENSKNVLLVTMLQRLQKTFSTEEALKRRQHALLNQTIKTLISDSKELNGAEADSDRKKKKKKKKAKKGKSAKPALQEEVGGSHPDEPSQAVKFGATLKMLKQLSKASVKNSDKKYILDRIQVMLEEIEGADKSDQEYFKDYFCLMEKLFEEITPCSRDLENEDFLRLGKELMRVYEDKIAQHYSSLLAQNGRLDELLVLAQATAASPAPARFFSPAQRARSAPRSSQQSPGQQIELSPASFSKSGNRHASPACLGVRKPTDADVSVRRGPALDDEAEVKKLQASIDACSEALNRKRRSLNKVQEEDGSSQLVSEESFSLSDDRLVGKKDLHNSSRVVFATGDDESIEPLNLYLERPTIDVYAITTISSSLSSFNLTPTANLSFISSEIVRSVHSERRLSLNPSLLIVHVMPSGEIIYPAPPINYEKYNYRLAGTAIINEKLNSVSCAMHVLGISLLPYNGTGSYVVLDRLIYQVNMWIRPYEFAYGLINTYFVPQPRNQNFTIVPTTVSGEEASSLVETTNESLDASTQIQNLSGDLEATYHFFESVSNYPELKRLLIVNACRIFKNRLEAEIIDPTCIAEKSLDELFNEIVFERLRSEDLEKIVDQSNILTYLRHIDESERHTIQCALIIALSHRFRHVVLFDSEFLNVSQFVARDYKVDEPLRVEFFNRVLEAWSKTPSIKKDNVCLLPVFTLNMRDEIEPALAGDPEDEIILNKIHTIAQLIGRLSSVMPEGRFEKNKIYIFSIFNGRDYVFVAIQNSFYRLFDPRGFDFKQAKIDRDIEFLLTVLSSRFGIQALKDHRNERIQEAGNTYLSGPICLAVIGYMMHYPGFFINGELPDEYSCSNSSSDRGVIQQLNKAVRSMPEVNAETILKVTECKKMAVVSERRPRKTVQFSLGEPVASGSSASCTVAGL